MIIGASEKKDGEEDASDILYDFFRYEGRNEERTERPEPDWPRSWRTPVLLERNSR